MEQAQEMKTFQPNSENYSSSNSQSLSNSLQPNKNKFSFLNPFTISKVIICIIITIFLIINTIQTFMPNNTPAFKQSDLLFELLKILQVDQIHNSFLPKLLPILEGNHTSF